MLKQDIYIPPADVQNRITTSPGWRDLFALCKPGITALLVFTAVTTAWVGSGPWLSPVSLILLALVGGLTSAGAAALNQYLDRDLDASMSRTARRPLPSGRISNPKIALNLGLLLSGVGLGFSLVVLPYPATILIGLGLLIYIPLYTVVLKRSTAWNTVLGGAAGCFPVLAGWAVSPRTDWPVLPFALAALVFFWTPAHFWAYAIVHAEGYRKANLPILPAKIGAQQTAPFIFAHVLVVVVLSLIAFNTVKTGFIPFTVGFLGLIFLGLSFALWHKTTNKIAWMLYKYSNYYLVLIFLSLLFV